MRSRLVLITGVTWAAVSVVLVAVPLALRRRLPDPLATHWSGASPDGHQTFTGFVLFACGMWLFLAAVAALALAWGLDVERRWARALYGAVVGGFAGLTLGAEWMIIMANFDRASWREAEMSPSGLLLLAGAAGGLGLIGWLAGLRGPDRLEPGSQGSRPAVLLGPGQRGVWYSRTTSRWVPFTVAGSAVLAGATLLWASPDVALPIAFVVAAIAVFGSMLGSVSASVNERGLTVVLGWLGWPRFRIPLRRIEKAWAAERRKEFAVSVDDAERGAGLINTLLSEGGSPTVSWGSS